MGAVGVRKLTTYTQSRTTTYTQHQNANIRYNERLIVERSFKDGKALNQQQENIEKLIAQ